MRIAIVQFGVLHEVYASLRAGGAETYYAQRYSVDYVSELAEKHQFVGVCGFLGKKQKNVALTDSLHSACIPLNKQGIDYQNVIALLDRWQPDRLILQAPSRAILRWALNRRIDTLPLFADSFEFDSVKRKIDAFLLGRLLNNKNIRAVGNHNIPASLSLKNIGVSPSKIFPWDWPHALRPENNPVKTAGHRPAKLVFVGSLSVIKGAADCIEAAQHLKTAGLDFAMTVIGGGEYFEEAQQKIEALGLSDHVRLTGKLSHDEVVEHLKAATLSLVPSHHIYPEGLPMTIYEALATRTPLAISDHPMFRLYLENTPAARMVPEKQPAALAEVMLSLLTDKAAYRKASEATEALWNRIKCDLTWGKLLDAWLDSDPSRFNEIREFALDRQIKNFQ